MEEVIRPVAVFLLTSILFFTSCKKQGTAGESVFEPTIQGINITVDAGIDQAQNTPTFNLDATSSTASGKTYSWAKVSGPGTATFANSSAEDTSVTVSVDGLYVFAITVAASSGDSAADSVVVIYDTVAPVVDAGLDATLKSSAYTQNATVTDTNQVSYVWSVDAGPGSIVAASIEDPSLSVTADGSYTIRLTGTDIAGNSSFDTFLLDWDSTVPSVSAGIDVLVSTLTFQDALTSDSNAMTWSWTKVSGPGNITFSSPSTEDTNISADTDGLYVLRLTATDTFGNTNSDVMNFGWDTTAPFVSQVVLSNTDGSYGAGTVLNVEVIFSEPVNVTLGTPQITLEMGATDRVANYSSGSGSSTLTFSYTTQSGDTNVDLDYINSGALVLNGSSIQDDILNNASLALAVPGAVGSISDDQAVVVDTTAPSLVEVKTNNLDGAYTTAQTVDLIIVYDEPVSVTGTPQLTLETGAADAVVDYTSGTGTTELTFSYTVASGHSSLDLDYQNTTSLFLNGGFIRDLASNNAGIVLATPGLPLSISDDKAIVIDTVAPFVAEVNTSSLDGLYGQGSTIPIQVVFSESVTVTGLPQLILETGIVDAVVSYTSGSGTDTLTFDYVVAAGDMNTDLDYVSISSLTLNGGAIDDGANQAVLTLSLPGMPNSISDDQTINVDTSGPTVSQVRANKLNGSYPVGEIIDVYVEWSEVVTVTGVPTLTLETGASDAVVNYFSGTGSDTLTFRYTVAANEESNALEYTGINSLNLNGGTIKNLSSADADLDLAIPSAVNSISDNQFIVIDGVSPVITQVRANTPNSSYGTGAVIDIFVEFSELVNVVGFPQITLETGVTDSVVNYSGGTGSDTLTFQYTVSVSDDSVDLDYQSISALVLGGGNIRDLPGNDADLTLATPGALNSISDNQDIVIDNISPTVVSVISTNADGGYGVGAPISIEVIFDEVVDVTGSPQITLELGVTDKDATYSSGSGSDTLTFTYNIASGDTASDLDYSSTFALQLNAGTIDDIAGNSANLTLASPGAVNSISDDQSIVIDTVVPTLGQVLSLKADGTYGIGENIDIIIQYDESVYVTGTPRIRLETGVLDQEADYTSGSGTSLLTFSYLVASGDVSGDLDYVNTSSLLLNGGTIKDIGNNDAPIVLSAPGTAGSISDDKAIIIDAIIPTVTDVSSSKADGGYPLSEVIDILVAFDDIVYVTGTPQIILETGLVDSNVDYFAGNGTSVLTFRYTVSAGDIATDLEYGTANSLILNGGTISDVVSNNAVLTLAIPGSAGSISDNQNIMVDAVDPIVDAGTDKEVNAISAQDATVTDDTVVIYSWTQLSGPGTATFSSSSVEDPDISADVDGTYTLQLEATDEGGNSVTDTIQFVWDTTPPPALSIFSGATATGLDNAMIDIVVNFPVDVSDYDQVDIRGIVGATPPADCSSGTVYKTYTTGNFIDDTFVQETYYPGGYFSFRACLRDKSGNEASSQTAINVQASNRHKFFVTSASFQGNLDSDYMAESFANSHDGVDFRCQSLADSAGLSTASDKWVGIISTPLMSAVSKIQVNGIINSTNSQVVANNKADLWNGPMIQSNGYDEYGNTSGSDKIWSGTFSVGNLSTSNCNSFTDNTTGFNGRVGQSDLASANWISLANQTCDNLRRVWCISQNANIPNISSQNITTGALARQVDYSFTLSTDPGVERFYQKIEVYRKTSAGAPTYNCDGSDGSVLSRTFNGPFTVGQVLTHTDATPDAPGTNYNFTICTYDKDSNPAIRSSVLGVSSGL